MKTMTCNQLGGACDKKFQANTFGEIAALSKKHGMDLLQKGDKAHIDAMNQMQDLMKSPGDMDKWFDKKRDEFNSLPEDM